MFGSPVSNGLTLTKVIGGISKTLSIANQVIPLYREAKPMINNAKTILSVLKGVNTSKTSNSSGNASTNITQQKKDTPKVERKVNTNNPVFFL